METQMDDVTETVAPTAAEVLAFLNGAGPINGNWFGEPKPEGTRGNFWWRKYLAALDLPAIKAAARREAFEEAANLADARAEYYAMSGHPDRFACSEIAAAIRELAATNERTNND
jgi:hypothetical protein